MAGHQTNLEISPSIPPELDAGTSFTIKVRVTCPSGCDLRGTAVRVIASDEVLASELTAYDAKVNETASINLRVPVEAGEHSWTIVFPKHEIQPVAHEESSLVICFTARPHPTSMALWDVPSPVVISRPFKIKAGVKCMLGCSLHGRIIGVWNEGGVRIGQSTLGDTPWPGTMALHVAEIELTAPATEGMTSWSARFEAGESGLPHEESSATFSFRATRPPEYKVRVKTMEKDSQVPLENVDVRLGLYRATTDAQGLAILELPGGVYDLDAWKAGYETPPTTIDVSNDMSVQVEAVPSPEKDPDEAQVWM